MLPPVEVVPEGAVESLEIAQAALAELKRLRARFQSIPARLREAKAEYQQASTNALRDGKKTPTPTAIKKLEAEQDDLPQQIQAATRTAIALAVEFGNTTTPLLPEHRLMALESLAADVTEIEAAAVALSKRVEQAGAVLGVVKWCDQFDRTPRYNEAQIQPAVTGVAQIIAEARRLAEFAETEQVGVLSEVAS